VRPLPQRSDLKIRKTDAETTVALLLLAEPSRGLRLDKADLLTTGWQNLTDGILERLEAIRKTCTDVEVKKDIRRLIIDLRNG
jgi:hypothetical protein